MTKIDFHEASIITDNLNKSVNDFSMINSNAKGIDASQFSSFSSSTVALTEQFKSGINDILTKTDNLSASFSSSIDQYYQAFLEEKRKVKEDLKTIDDTPITAKVTEEVKEEIPVGTVTINLDDNKESELRETTKFYYNYPGNVREVHEITSTKMASLLEKNGALKASNGSYGNGQNVTRGSGDGWYLFQKDGHYYEYNVNTNEIITDFKLPSGQNKKATFNCKFFVRDDTDFDTITNTITVCGGQGILEKRNPVYNNDQGRTLLTGLKTNDNTLVSVPYGDGYGTIGYNIAPGVASATRIGNFMAGGSTKKVTNSLIGFSLGGEAAYQTVATNKGLYQKLVIVNSAMKTKDYKLPNGGSFDNFKDIDIVLLQANNDKTYGPPGGGSYQYAIKRLEENGIPLDRVSLYTTDSTVYNFAAKHLKSENVHNLAGEADKSWQGHSNGINLIKNSGIMSYLSSRS